MDIAVQRVPGKRAGSFIYVTEDNYIFHQNFWSFIKHLQECNENRERDFIAIRAAQQIRRQQRLVSKRRDRNIKTLTEQLTSGAIQIYEFLDVADEFFEPDQLDRTADGLARPAPENDDLEGQAGIVAEEPAPVHRQPVRRRRLSPENVDEVPAIRGHGRPRRIRIENLELRRVPVAAAAAPGVVEPVIVAPAVVEPILAAPPVVASDHHDPHPAHICDICTINPKNKIFIPCGHTVCHQCAEQLERLPRNPCFYCRTPVDQISIIFPELFLL